MATSSEMTTAPALDPATIDAAGIAAADQGLLWTHVKRHQLAAENGLQEAATLQHVTLLQLSLC